MSMRVVPKKFYDGELRVIPSEPGYLVLECEAIGPPSSKGKTVYVIFDGEEVVKLLAEAKHSAIRARSQPMTSQP